jgi:hypothetical protein
LTKKVAKKVKTAESYPRARLEPASRTFGIGPARIEQLKFSLSNYVLGFKEYMQQSGYIYKIMPDEVIPEKCCLNHYPKNSFI